MIQRLLTLFRKQIRREQAIIIITQAKKWGDAKSYDLCVDSGLVGIEGAIEVILKFIELKEKNQGIN